MLQHLRQLLTDISRGYGWVALIPSRRAGTLMLLATLIHPLTGLLGLLSAICAYYAGQLAGANQGERPVCVFNGLLIGLFIAHLWQINSASVALIVMTGIFAGWLSVVMGRVAWSLVQLPILSLPFALLAMLTFAANKSLSQLSYQPYVAPTEIFGNIADKFLSALGGLYFLPDPLVGLFILIILFCFSRYYVLIAILGYGCAAFWLKQMGGVPENLASSAWDNNAILAALLVGGLFARPSFVTALLAVFAAAIACWMSLAFERILSEVGLMPFSIPFVLAAWLVLYAATRNNYLSHRFNVHHPDFPERSHERAQLAAGRLCAPGSVPLALPFTGSWMVSQGFSGQHTHRGQWRYAVDFIVMREGKSFAGNGKQLEDFYCYNLPVLSPAYGQVWRVANDVADNTQGTVNVVANWGNCVVIRMSNGLFAVIAHLKPGSVQTYAGAWLRPGDLIGFCGNSGRSPQPHIHLHVQTGDDPSCPTVPFHFANVLANQAEQIPHYQLNTIPKEHMYLANAPEGDVRPFYLLAGRGLRYTIAHQDTLISDWSIHCEVDEQGRLVLISSKGARCIAEASWAVFSGYERSGPADIYFDLWLLACGYTPTSYQVEQWQEHATPSRLLPSSTAKLIGAITWPFASFCRSYYQRHWVLEQQAWLQTARHQQKITGIEVTTEAFLVPQLGCSYLSAKIGKQHYTLQASSSFQKADIGVPAWEVALFPLKH